MLSSDEIMKLKVSELKEELTKRGCSTSGLKSELQAKLESAIEAEENGLPTAVPPKSATKRKQTPTKPKTPSSSTINDSSSAKKVKTPKTDGKSRATPVKAAVAKPKPKSPPTSKISDSAGVDDKTEAEDSTKTTEATMQPKNPRSTNFEYEFGGPLGAVGVMVGLPMVIYGLFFFCGGISGTDGQPSFCVPGLLPSLKWVTLSQEHVVSKLPPLSKWWSNKACAIVAGWFLFQALLERLLPGEVVEGVVLPDGVSRLKYKLNGHLAFWVSLLAMGHAWPRFHDETGAFQGLGAFPLHELYDEFLGITTAAIVLSMALSAAVYASSFKPGATLAEGGKSGNPVYDFFIGRELNPRVGGLDLKFFCELRPGLIGWVVLNLGMAAKQRRVLGGAVSAPMVLVNLFQGLYVWDALFYERAILTTMDITTDGFGFMLAFGDLAWVPLTYTLQARYLVDHDPELSSWALALICVLNCGGYLVFRGANSEKDAFRRDPTSPHVKHLQFMPTARGTKLLVSGWWGMARKINYTGDWCMGLAWCLLAAGTTSLVPYFYAIYFGVLLVHRAGRDDAMCRAKYGEDWDEYKKKVPATFVPGLPF